MSVVCWPLDNSGAYTGRMLREAALSFAAPMGNTARPLSCLSSVRWGTPTTTVSVSGSTWSVGEHAGVIDAETAAEAGPYGYAVNSVQTGSVNAADPNYTRIDLVSMQVSDPAESDGTSTPGCAAVYTPGTPAASPAAPAAPARSLVLAELSTPKSGGGATTVTWLAPWATGDRAGFQTLAQLKAWTTAPLGAYATVLADTINKDGAYEWDGTYWSPRDTVGATGGVASNGAPAAGQACWVQSGSTVVTTDGSGNFVCDFATPFPNGCVAVVAMNTNDNAAHGVGVTASGVSQNGWDGWCGVNSGDFQVSWIAVGW